MGPAWDQPGADPIGDLNEWLEIGRESLPGGKFYVAHRHWPAIYQATGSPERPIYVCSCGEAIALDESSGKFRIVVAATGAWSD